MLGADFSPSLLAPEQSGPQNGHRETHADLCEASCPHEKPLACHSLGQS